MIWNTLAPLYDFFETLYNGKVFKGIAIKIKEYVCPDDIVLENVKLQQMSLPDIPFDDNSFDLVVAANVIHLLDDPEAALKSMVRVCKPGGKIVIPTYINNQKKNAVFAAKLLSLLGVQFKKQFSLETYQQFFRQYGYNDVEMSVVDGRMPCAFALIKKYEVNK